MTTAYPLQWPEGWPRGRAGNLSDARFGSNLTVQRAARALEKELTALGAKGVVLSTNLKATLGSSATEGRGSSPKDPGAAIYFEYLGQQMVMAQEIFQSVAGNIRSLGLAIEAMRQLERHGGGYMMKRAFQGFAQLLPPSGSPQTKAVDWRVELGPFLDGLDAADVLVLAESRYRLKAKMAHSDRTGGDDSRMIVLNAAIAAARIELEDKS